MMNFLNKIIISFSLAVSSLFGGNVSQVTPTANLGAAPQYVAARPTYLYGGGISSSDTSIKLTSLVTPDGTPITTAQLVGSAGNVFYGTIEPATTKKETVSCNAVTQNGDGTATITGCTRGLQFTTPYTPLTSLALSHSGGSSFVLSNSPQMYNDIINYIASTTFAGTVDASPIQKGIVEVATANEAASHALVGTGDTSAYLTLTTNIASSTRTANTAQVVVSSSTDGYIDSSYISTSTLRSQYGIVAGKFGGTGADGAFSTTTAAIMDLGGQAVFVKNYTSISITGTGSLTFTNPHTSGTIIILKSQENVTLTSSATPMIDASGMGGAGGAGSAGNGNPGSNSTNGFVLQTSGGGASNTGPTAGTAGAKAAVSVNAQLLSNKVLPNYIYIAPGSGGGSGSNQSGTLSGAGGNGGAGLIMEVRGALNFTTTGGISVAGKNGSNSNPTSGQNVGGGGGGGGGSCAILYNSLTSGTGTIITTGGTGGTSANVTGFAASGGGGASISSNGTAGGTGATAGGNGGPGYSLVAQNTEF